MILLKTTLRRHWPSADEALIDGFVAQCANNFADFEINTARRLAHFLGQISHESRNATHLVESLNYSTAQRIHDVWKTRFPTVASAAPFVHKAKALALFVYGDRMGNRPGTDDGFTYRGRGYIQLTGRENYEKTVDDVGVDLVSNPDLAVHPAHALCVACSIWKRLGGNQAADTNSVTTVTLKINVGRSGLADRLALTTVLARELGCEKPAL
jgi:putative chitinase